MNRLTQILGSLVIMVFGVGLVLTLMIVMNRYTQPPKKEERRVTANVEIKKIKPKPKKKAARPKPRRAKPRTVRRMAPQPKLSSALSGVDLGNETRFGRTSDDNGDSLLQKTGGKNLLMTSATVDEPPKATRKVSPKYPIQARKDGVTGFVSFSLIIGSHDEIQSAKVIRSKPAGVFEEAARQAIERWTFRPGMYKGKAQTVMVEQTIRFKLSRGA